MGESLTKACLGGIVREMEQGTVVKVTIKTWEQNSLKIYILQKCIASAVRHFNQIVFCMSMGALASVI